MRYWQAGKEKSLSVGVYPKVSLGDARKKREELLTRLEAQLGQRLLVGVACAGVCNL